MADADLWNTALQAAMVSLSGSAVLGTVSFLQRRRRRVRAYREALELLELERRVEAVANAPAARALYDRLREEYADISPSEQGAAQRAVAEQRHYDDFVLIMLPTVAFLALGFLEGSTSVEDLMAIGFLSTGGLLSGLGLEWLLRRITRNRWLGYFLALIFGIVQLIGLIIVGTSLGF